MEFECELRHIPNYVHGHVRLSVCLSVIMADGVSTLQLQSSETRFRHGGALRPLVVDNSEMGLKPNSSYKPMHDPLRSLVLRVYLLNWTNYSHSSVSVTEQ